jgi:protein involved in polysaccharide export with SLBB domain
VIRDFFRHRQAAIWCVLVASFTSSLAYGQTQNQDQSNLQQAGRATTRPYVGPSGTTVTLEGKVDPAKYILGPGDHLEFDVWGTFESQQEVVVAPDGKIALSSVGELMVAGLTLAAADSLMHKAASSPYPRAGTQLRLLSIRRMKATISGAVVQSGVYEVSAVERISTLVSLAGGLLEQSQQEKEDDALRDLTLTPRTTTQRRAIQRVKDAQMQRPRSSQRHLKITSREGSEREVDLQRFYVTGDLEFNPVLRDGDVVKVPLLDRAVGVLTVFGAVKDPGEYEYCRGDRLRDILELAGGVTIDAQMDAVLIVRFSADARSQSEIKCDLSDSSSRGPGLEPDDRIFVRRKPDFRKKYQVTVKGEVFFPGTYPIDEEQTRLTEIIAACGGITDRANLNSARITRRAMEEVEDPEYERLKTLTVGEMTDMEYEYFKIRSREEAPPVVVNFAKLFEQGDATQDILLQDKDEIEIPTISPTVKVAGQVNNPGLIRYIEGKDYEYYIGKAGGFSWNARTGKMRLIKAHSGMWIKPRTGTPIEIGDTIFVPEKQETDWWTLSKDLLLAVSQIATVLIMIRSL